MSQPITVTEMQNAIKTFEERNDMSVTICFHSDGSGGVQEFWTEKDLVSCDTSEELLYFLKTIKIKQ